MKVLYLLLALALMVLVASFAMLNAKVVWLNYFLGSAQIPLALLLVVVFALGACVSGLLMAGPIMRLTLQNRRLQSQISKQAQSKNTTGQQISRMRS